MAKLIYKDELGLNKPKTYNRPKAKDLLSLLNDVFPNGLTEYCHHQKLNGVLIPKKNVALKDSDVVEIILEPKGFVGDVFKGVGKLTAGIFKLVGIDLTPDFDTAKAGSPNNTFSGQSNIVRTNAAIPLMLGSPTSYPDLLGAPVIKYSNNRKLITQYMYLSWGKLNTDNATVSAKNTPLNNILGAKFQFYKPVDRVTTIPNYIVGSPVDEIDGQRIDAKNEGTQNANKTLIAINNNLAGNPNYA